MADNSDVSTPRTAADSVMGATQRKTPTIKHDNSEAVYLENLATDLMLAHNSLTDPSSLAFLRSHCDPDFQMIDTSIHENPIPASNGLETHIASTAAFFKAHPTFEIVLDNVSVQIDARDGRHAVVWMTEKGCSSSEERAFNRESVSRLYFRKREGEQEERWMWYKHASVRGGGDLFS